LMFSLSSSLPKQAGRERVGGGGGGGGGVQQIQLRTEDRENGYLGAAAPQSGVLEAAVIWYKEFHVI